jgi:hypothetical protein
LQEVKRVSVRVLMKKQALPWPWCPGGRSEGGLLNFEPFIKLFASSDKAKACPPGLPVSPDESPTVSPDVSASPVPEGMTATIALRVQAFSARHEALRRRLEEAAEDFERDQGYRPPYWELLGLVRGFVAPGG